MRGVLAFCIVLACLWNAGARADGPVLSGIPALDIVLHEPATRLPGDSRLPAAELSGPDGLSNIPHVDRRGHRSVGLSTRTFPRPSLRGGRLDWCSAPGFGCGPQTAQHFCEAKGFARVVEAVEERDVGLYTPTRQIASGLSCSGKGCSGFLRITCTRS